MSQWWQNARGLYAIIDPEHCAGRAPLAIAEQVIEGGCAVLQLRAKGLGGRDLLSLARALRTVCAKAGVPFVMNDRADIARLADADGLHLGQDDLPVEAARATVGSMCIGVSTHDRAQAARAADDGADVLGFGPVFETATKDNPDPVVGLETLAKVCAECDIPVIAIGGVTLDNAASIIACGPRFIASISAITEAKDVVASSRALHALAHG